MKHTNLRKNLLAAAVTFALSSAAMASPVFTINPMGVSSVNPLNILESTFQATYFTGNSSELLTLTPGGIGVGGASGTGWVQIGSATNVAANVAPNTSGIGVDYNLYLTFSLTDTLVAGSLGAANSVYTMTAMSFQVWADPSLNPFISGSGDVFTNADAPTNTQASVLDVGSNDILLAVGQIGAPGTVGTAGFDGLGGAYLNAITSFGVCNGVNQASFGGVIAPVPGCTAAGSAYFAAPNPFYQVAFSDFNNTTQGILTGVDGAGNHTISITNAGGNVDFNTVPEPATLALLGLGLLGMGAVSRRRQA
jgi:hypothetical protein